MAQDMAELASALFGRSRLETHVSDGSQTSTVYGRATSDSDGGKVNVVLGDAETADGGTNAVELATTTSVKSGDNVIVTLVGGEVGKHPVVTGVVGRGDEVQRQIEDAASSGGPRVFTEQPVPPYDRGDLWAMAPTSAAGDYGDAEAQPIGEHEDAGATWGSLESYEGRTVYVCTTAKAAGESFDAADWSETVDWTGHYVTNSRLERTDDRITAEVSARTEITDQLGQAVAQKADTSTVQQTAQDLTATFTTALDGKADKTIIRESSDGIEVGKSGGQKAIVGSDGSFKIGESASHHNMQLTDDRFDVLEHVANGSISAFTMAGQHFGITTEIETVGSSGPEYGHSEINSTGSLKICANSNGDQTAPGSLSLYGKDGVSIGSWGTGIKNIVCGSTGVYINATGNAKLFSGDTYGTKDSGHSNLIVSSGDHNAFTGNVTAWWANDGSGDWWVHADVVNKDIRVNWTLLVW